jgi:hypothetical protein
MRNQTLLLVVFLLSFGCFAEAVFTPTNEKEYFAGDFVRGVLRFNPQTEGNVLQLKKQKISENIFIHDIRLLNPGEAGLTLIPLGTFDTSKNLVWNGTQINFSSLKLGQSNITPKGFVILEESVKKSFLENIWLFLVIALIFSLVWGILWKIKKNKNFLELLKIGRQNKISFWKEKLELAKERKDFENIYFKRKEWMFLLEVAPNKAEEFFIILNRYQFKRNWNEGELLEVRESFLRLKNGI